jgi:hypothetical protein
MAWRFRDFFFPVGQYRNLLALFAVDDGKQSFLAADSLVLLHRDL